MDVTFKKIEKLDNEFIERMIYWENHPDYRHLYGYFSDKESFDQLSNFEKVAKYYENFFETKNQETFYVLVDNVIVGEVNFIIDPDWLHKKVPNTAWFGGTVGEPNLWRKGIGIKAAQFIEQRAILKGATRAELGINEFNEASLKLAQKLGYQEFDRIADFTFWNDKMWADVRMEKIYWDFDLMVKTRAKTKKLSDWREELLEKIRKIVMSADPKIIEELKWGDVPTWSCNGIICTGETYKSVVKMTFAKGASLKDPSGLFNSSLEGNLRRAIDFREGDKVNEKALKALIKSAVKLNASKAKK